MTWIPSPGCVGQHCVRSRSPARSRRYASNLDTDDIDLDPLDPAWRLSGAPQPCSLLHDLPATVCVAVC